MSHHLNQTMHPTDSPMNTRGEYRHITTDFGAVLKGVDIAGIDRQDVC